jgi:hypothetical protein
MKFRGPKALNDRLPVTRLMGVEIHTLDHRTVLFAAVSLAGSESIVRSCELGDVAIPTILRKSLHTLRVSPERPVTIDNTAHFGTGLTCLGESVQLKREIVRKPGNEVRGQTNSSSIRSSTMPRSGLTFSESKVESISLWGVWISAECGER